MASLTASDSTFVNNKGGTKVKDGAQRLRLARLARLARIYLDLKRGGCGRTSRERGEGAEK